MARPLRIEYPGAFYHVIQRGIENRDIFHEDKDKERFLSCLNSANTTYGEVIHAYVIMDNHYHLIIETPQGNLSRIMHYINTSYAAYYNAKNKRVGPLYQGRYKSIIVQAEEYLHHLSRYIHLNPVRAKIVDMPDMYKWSSYGYFTTGEQAPEYMETELIISMFGKSMKRAKEKYKRFVLDEMGKEKEVIKENLKKGFVLGNESFFKSIVGIFIDKEEDAEIPVLRKLKKKKEPGLEEIEKIVKKNTGDNRRLTRQLMLYFSRKYTQNTLYSIAKYIGNISDTGVSQAVKRALEARKNSRKLDKLMGKIEKEIELSRVET